jgi:hypothetical protein
MKRTTSMTVLNNYIENTSEYLNNFKVSKTKILSILKIIFFSFLLERIYCKS